MNMILNGMSLPLYAADGSRAFAPDEDESEVLGNEAFETVSETIQKGDLPFTVDPEVNVYDQDVNFGLYFGVIVYGGENGTGVWSTYLSELGSLVSRLESQVEDCWLIRLDIDCPDDVFIVELGIKMSREAKPSKE